MIELKIPYIGVKIESIPTILKILKTAVSDNQFISYYTDLGKSIKTATEYLASLRNLKLAGKDNFGRTILLPAGENLLKDDINLFYSNLLKHSIKHFPDLKIIKDILFKDKGMSLNSLIEKLNISGYYIKRKQTLSSFYKLIIDGGKYHQSKRIMNSNYSREPLEYNQFIKILKKYSEKRSERKIIISDFFDWISKIYFISKEDFVQFLGVSRSASIIKLYEINEKAISDSSNIFVVSGKIIYFLEIL